jgi:hypothetical protein
LSDDLLAILKAQSESHWAGEPGQARNAFKLVKALLPFAKGRLNRNLDLRGSSPSQRSDLGTGASKTEDPHVLSTPTPPCSKSPNTRVDQPNDAELSFAIPQPGGLHDRAGNKGIDRNYGIV